MVARRFVCRLNAEFLPLNEAQAAEKTGGRLPGFKPFPDDTHDHKEFNRQQGEEILRMVQEAASPGFARPTSQTAPTGAVERKVRGYARSVDQSLAASHKDLQALVHSPAMLREPAVVHAQLVELFQRQSAVMMQLALTTGAAQGFSNVLSSLLKNSS